jgi:hypothetical protein
MIIALNLVLSIIALTHAAIYVIAFEPGDIDIITSPHAAIYDYRLEPGDIDTLSP